MKAIEIFNAINLVAPFSVCASYDNPGFLVGNPNDEVSRVMVCLDITKDVVEEAHMQAVNLIVSHHPVIFKPIMRVCFPDVPYLLARYGINAICAHTNLDVAKGGVNDVLASKIGIDSTTEILFDCENLPLGRVGNIKAADDVKSFALFVKGSLQANTVRFTNAGMPVKRVAVIGGACDEQDLENAKGMNVDTLVTGDCKYHMFLRAKEIRLNLIDAGHFATENPIVPVLRDMLIQRFSELDIMCSSVHHDVVESI